MHAGNVTVMDDPGSRSGEAFQRLLLELSSAANQGQDTRSLLRLFCQTTREFFQVSGSYFWQLESGDQLVGTEADGFMADEFRGTRISLKTGPTAVAVESIRSHKTVYLNNVDLERYPIAREYHARSIMAAPFIISGKAVGAAVFVHDSDPAFFSDDLAAKATILAGQAAMALEMTRHLHLSEQHRRRAEALMSLARESSSLVRLPEFARSFLSRVASMLDAQAAALALCQDSKLETVVLAGSQGNDPALLRRLNVALSGLLPEHRQPIFSAPAHELLGAVAPTLGWNDLTVARLSGTDGELVGLLCLANRGQAASQDDELLLEAIVGQASVALENARLFTRMDQANRHWLGIFDALSDFIVVHDEHDRVLRVNRSLAEFIGVPPPELIGISMSALMSVAPYLAPRCCPFCRSEVEGPDEFVQPVLERTYLVSTSRVHASESESLQTIHVLKDITDRREAERRYRELFDNIQEGLFFTSPEGRFIEVNEALVRMLGYESREELLEAEVPTQIYSSPERRRELTQLVEQRGVLRNYHETLRRKDGSLIHVLMNAFAVRDAQGRLTQYRGLMLDITDLKNFQSELQRERDFSSKILNNTQSLILVADTAGLISYANRRWYEAGGYHRQQLLGRPLMELIAPTRRSAVQEALSATLCGQQVDNLELPVMRADGRTGQFSVNLSPMRDDQGHVSSIVVVMTDITDAAMLHAKLMHTEKMAAVGQLVSGVAHEVNNPLTAILGFADLLMENPELPDAAIRDLRVILQEAQRTKQIVQNLLSFARQMPPQRQPVQLNSILSRTIKLRAYDFSSHGVEVVEKYRSDLPDVIGDSHQLQQVFLNIINNAYDAVRETGRPPRIEIGTSTVGGFAEVSFRDNGPGVAHPDRIFDPFFTTKEVGKGTGLGLSICYGIVREHGGEIFCHNHEDGPGATFIVRLPAVSETATVGASAGVV
jgi:PAS domain S-box-containing protein